MSIAFSGPVRISGFLSALGGTSGGGGGGGSFITATGGTITTVGNYKVHTFTSSGTFAVTNVPVGANAQIEYLVVGGGGGSPNTTSAGGGGGGGFITNVSDNNYIYFATLPSANANPSGGAYLVNQGGYGNGKWVLPRDNGGIWTSTDAVNWTYQGVKLASSGSMRGVAYGNNLFMGIAYTSTGANVYTSTDGVTWTQTNTTFATAPITSMDYVNGYFYVYTNNEGQMRSVNGVTWTSVSVPVSATEGNFIYDTRAGILLWQNGANIYKSSDNGTTWNPTAVVIPNSWTYTPQIAITSTHYFAAYPTSISNPGYCMYSTSLFSDGSMTWSNAVIQSANTYKYFAGFGSNVPNTLTNYINAGGSATGFTHGAWVDNDVAYFNNIDGVLFKFDTSSNTAVFSGVLGVGFGATRIAGNGTVNIYAYRPSFSSTLYPKVDAMANVLYVTGVLSYAPTLTAVVNNYTIVVGGGGAEGVSGSNSSFGDITAVGGGAGGGGGGSANGYAGGSGGGSSTLSSAQTNGFGNNVPTQGTIGHTGLYNSKTSQDFSGSGGGAGGGGGIRSNNPGRLSQIDGTSTWYAGGASGTDATNQEFTMRGLGGMSGWTNNSITFTGETPTVANSTWKYWPAKPNSGGGGGGGSGSFSSGGISAPAAGGSGVVIIRYRVA